MKKIKLETIMDDCENPMKNWADDLPNVLDLIRTNSARIVDDTSLERLLKCLSMIAVDNTQRQTLLDSSTGILNFLCPPFQTIFVCPLAANFALRLTGIISGSSLEAFVALEKSGTLEAMFSTSLQNSEFLELWKAARLQQAFFLSLSCLVSNSAGYKWIKERGNINQI